MVHDLAAAGDGVRRARLALWLATPFFTGATIMAQELVAFRLYAPYFGYSIYVWGSMISVVMAALAVGYAIGGWVADRSQTDAPLYVMVLASAVYQLGVLFTVRSLLGYLAHLGDFTGVTLASALIFAVPMTAMATACPFLIRLLAHSGRVGSAAGKVYAISTIGGIAGILATAFFLVPRLGTQKTLGAICVMSALVAAAGLARRVPLALSALGLTVVTVCFLPKPIWPEGTLWVADSPYNLVRVVRSGDWTILKLNDETGVHTIRDERTGWTGHYYDDFALGPLLIPARRLLVLGLGGGGSVASTRFTGPDIAIDAVEIDPKVVEAARRFFGLNPNDKLRIHIADARPWLAQTQEKYDLVHVDLYHGGPYIPFYLITVEFFEAVRAHMSPESLLMMNLFDISPGRELLVRTIVTLKRVFPTVMALSVGHGNRMLLAFSKDTSEDAIRERLQNVRETEAIEGLAEHASTHIVDYNIPPETTAFTDDFAPVEEITRRMLNSH
jgi:spermidine synthase